MTLYIFENRVKIWKFFQLLFILNLASFSFKRDWTRKESMLSISIRILYWCSRTNAYYRDFKGLKLRSDSVLGGFLVNRQLSSLLFLIFFFKVQRGEVGAKEYRVTSPLRLLLAQLPLHSSLPSPPHMQVTPIFFFFFYVT